MQGRSDETDVNCDIKVQCVCCKTYNDWKSRHPSEHELLRECAAKQEGYELLADEKVVVLEDGVPVEYTGVVHSTSCTGGASSNGDHPYRCDPCHTLITEELLPQKFNNA